MLSLRQTLKAISSHLPQGFDAAHGIKTLFPPAYTGSIFVLQKYVYLKSGYLKMAATSHADDLAWYFVGADGTGRWFFSWVPKPVSMAGDINLRVQAGFGFKFSHDSFGHGYVDTSRPPRPLHGSCNSGTDNWILLNWPQIFAADIFFGWQEASGFDSLPPESNIWTSAGIGQSNFIALNGTNVACVGQGSGSPFFPLPTLTPDLYVTSIIASAQAQALKIKKSVTIDLNTVKQVLASSSFVSGAARSIESYIATPAAVSTVSDALVIANMLANIISPGLSPSALGQVGSLSSQLTAAHILAVASSVRVALAPVLPPGPPPPFVPSLLSSLKDGLAKAGDAAVAALDTVSEAALDAVREAAVNSGGDPEEMALEAVVDMAVWAASSIIVDGPTTTFSPNAGPDPGDAGVPGGTSDPGSGAPAPNP